MLHKLRVFWHELTRPMPLENNFSDYDAYWAARGFHGPSRRRAELIAPQIAPGSSVLDVGCGDGTILRHLKQTRGIGEAIGIDISAKAVEHVRAQGFQAAVVDVTSADFPAFLDGKSFDYIVVTEVIEHVQESEKVLESIRDHFTRAAFVSVPNTGFFLYRLRLLFGRFPIVLIQAHMKEHVRFWTYRDFRYWLDYLGFEVESVRVSAGLFFAPLAFLERWFPGLFASQIIYRIRRKTDS
jgi:methionine biosynthesis protein MetW